MNDTKNPGDKTLHVSPKTLSLKRPVEQGVVRQSFSHGRSKAVVVETVKRRPVAPGGAVEHKAAPPQAAAPPLRPCPRSRRRVVADAALRALECAPLRRRAAHAFRSGTRCPRQCAGGCPPPRGGGPFIAGRRARRRAEREAAEAQEREAAEARKREDDERRRQEDERKRVAEDRPAAVSAKRPCRPRLPVSPTPAPANAVRRRPPSGWRRASVRRSRTRPAGAGAGDVPALVVRAPAAAPSAAVRRASTIWPARHRRRPRSDDRQAEHPFGGAGRRASRHHRGRGGARTIRRPGVAAKPVAVLKAPKAAPGEEKRRGRLTVTAATSGEDERTRSVASFRRRNQRLTGHRQVEQKEKIAREVTFPRRSPSRNSPTACRSAPWT